MEKKDTANKTKKRLPQEVRALLDALHYATKRLLNSGVTCSNEKEMYAIFAEESTVDAFAFLLIGLARYTTIEQIEAEETESRILIRVAGKYRVAHEPLTYRDLLPAKEEDRATLERDLRFNRMTYQTEEREGAPLLTVSLPRYRVDDCDVCAVNKEETRTRIYCVMRAMAGITSRLPRE